MQAVVKTSVCEAKSQKPLFAKPRAQNPIKDSLIFADGNLIILRHYVVKVKVR
jgi:hypothetical protein